MTTPTLRLTDDSVTTATVDALVVGTMSGEGGPRLLPGSDEVDAAFDGRSPTCWPCSVPKARPTR